MLVLEDVLFAATELLFSDISAINLAFLRCSRPTFYLSRLFGQDFYLIIQSRHFLGRVFLCFVSAFNFRALIFAELCGKVPAMLYRVRGEA